ncbi:DUF7261 family protein [Haloarcula nitratireducens]|uniref:Flagellin n=1 Tax=Haloarcula nitratireducens TaxID=2487749 RepID=A0AAW4PLJ3_9EURY|nr:hypothetical protein [Halomicroarcula nitratireducens]MBX0298256.1 hypothetical protein [Halomicroarcula nitratireducens]
MADVTDRDRGQLIVITGLAIALALVVMVLLLNSVIYTGNLATRSVDAGSQSAIAYQQTTTDGVGAIVDRVNTRNYTSWSAAQANVTENISTYDAVAGRQYLDRGTVATINEPSLTTTDGYLIRHSNTSRAFTSANTTVLATGRQANWTVAQDVERVRNHQLTVTESSLTQTTTPQQGFSVAVVENGTSSQWHTYIYKNSTHILLAVKNESDTSPTPLPSCAVSGPTATIDLTTGTVNGTDCPGLTWAKGVSGPYDVEYQNGDAARGTYELTVAQSAGMDTLRDTHLYGPTSGQSPSYSYAVYSTSFEIVYETRTLHYRAPVRVAPEEPA